MSIRRHAPPSGLLGGLVSSGRPFVMLLALTGTFAGARPVHAQGGPAEAVAAGAAVAGVVLEAIGGLSSWLGDQSDDCAVAALGAAWGKDCNLNKKECTDTGYWSAYCSETAENDCAYGFGNALAQEGALGSWSGCTTKPSAVAFTKALHTTDDSHAARGWGKASVDGTSKSEEEATPGAAPGTRPLDAPPLAPLAGGWPDGSIVALVSVDTVSLTAGAIGTTSSRFQSTVRIDGVEIWSGSISLDGTGAVGLGGGLAGAAPATWFDPMTGKWELRLYGFQFEQLVGTFGDGAASIATATNVAVSMESEIEADASNANSGGSTTYVTVDPTMIAMNDPYGEPLLKGQYVQVMTPYVVTCPPSRFGTVMADFHLWHPQTNRGLGILDFAHVPELMPGQQVLVRGYVTHHEGRTILLDTELVPMQLQGLPPATPLSMPQFQLQAEEFENLRVHVVESLQYQGAQPITGGGLVTWSMPGGGMTLDTWLDPDAGPWPTIQPGTLAQLSGFVLQDDPEDPEHPERGRLAPLASDGQPGYHGGYYLRPESPVDLVLSTAGVDDDRLAALPNRPFALAQNHPNPFVPATTIAFRLDRDLPVRLVVVDVAGRRVRTLLDGSPGVGAHTVTWDGMDDAGRAAAGGLYFYTLDAGSARETRKMILAR